MTTRREMQFEIPIEIKSDQVEERHGEKQGRKWVMRQQRAWAHLGKEYPQEIVLLLDVGQEPYQPADYVIDSRSLYVNRYGSFQIRPRLHRVE